MRFRERGHRQVWIDLSPLIDVVFQLLIFFAVTTSFLHVSGLELELPEAETRDTERAAAGGADPALLTIELAPDGTLTFQGEPTTIERLEPQLKSAIEARPDAQVVLRADRDTRHGEVVRVMDVVRRSGARGLSVATRPPERERGRSGRERGTGPVPPSR